MPIEHNFQNFAEALARDEETYKEMVQDPLKEFIGKRFGAVSINEYMQDGPTRFEDDNYPPRRNSGPLRKLSGRLAKAVSGGGKDVFGDGKTFEQDTFANTTETGFIWVREIFVPYALIHEKGGTIPAHRIPVTQQMESYFWAKYYETGNVSPQTKIDVARGNKWRRLALAAKKKDYFNVPAVNIPARPYIEPALRDIQDEVANKGADLTFKFLQKVLG